MKRAKGQLLQILGCSFVALVVGSSSRTSANDVPLEPATSFALFGREESLFFCESCADALQAEEKRVWEKIVEAYPEAVLVARNKKLVNMYFVELPHATSQEIEKALTFFASLEEVAHTSLSKPLPLAQSATTEAVATSVGAVDVRNDYCASGLGVRVALIDSGIDYTHEVFGGEGTVVAYEAAYGDDKQRNGLFPTSRVVDGYDFVGEASLNNLQPDEDPIDAPGGHGTMVASSLLSAAPDVSIIAVKACLGLACGESAIVAAIEYALDPNNDGSIADRAHVLNLSIGSRFLGPYYSPSAFAVERAASLGAFVVAAAGNDDDIPYVMAETAKSPNCLAVGATGSPGTTNEGVMASFSSRGPGGGPHAIMKPDLVAPGGPTSGLAIAGSGGLYRSATGTSLATPIVAGVAALLIERCPSCSPLALKALLQNNVQRTTRYHSNSNEIAPFSWGGSGQVDARKAVRASVWAYSIEDALPSISLGLLDITRNERLFRTIRIRNISGNAQSLTTRVQFRDDGDLASGALEINLSQTQFAIEATVNSFVDVKVEFHIVAENVPTNHMSGYGVAARDVTRLDQNEYDGWIIFESLQSAVDISIPFYTILRQAANVTVGLKEFPTLLSSPMSIDLDLVNHGIGTAQIESYELLAVSSDASEDPYGGPIMPVDIRYVGYRSFEGEHSNCLHVLEFAFVLWERITIGHTVEHRVNFYGPDGSVAFVVVDGVANAETLLDECYIYDASADNLECCGFRADHPSNGVNTVLRVCSNDVGIVQEGNYEVSFLTRYKLETREILQERVLIKVPNDVLTAPSYDVPQGRTLEKINLTGSLKTPEGTLPLGLLLLTDSYRSPENTGAAIPGSEAFVVLRSKPSVQDPPELTKDTLEFPKLLNTLGPDGTWTTVPTSCSSPRRRMQLARKESHDCENEARDQVFTITQRSVQTACPERDLPRNHVLTFEPTVSPAPVLTEAPNNSSSGVASFQGYWRLPFLGFWACIGWIFLDLM